MVLLERGTFLGELNGLLREAAGGRGRVAFVGGEAGVGKSALVQAFAGAGGRAARVLIGACDPATTPRPLGPLADIAAQAGGELARLLDGGPRDQLFRASLRDFAESDRPTLVIVEDAHWADEATLDWLRYLGRRIGALRTLLLVTYRADEVGPRRPLRVLLGDLATAPTLRRIALPPLSAKAVAALAEGSAIDPEALYRQTGGNPFFVTEILAGSGGLPPTVCDAVLARAARLSPAGRAALDTVAVVGSRAEPWLLAALGADETAEEAIEGGMLRAEGRRIGFRHELARIAIADAIPISRAVALHRAVLTALRDHPDQRPALARLAHHAEAADDREAVLEYAPAAARQAAHLGAHREAAAQFARALRFADALPLSECAAMLEEYADENMHVDRLDETIRATREALALWRMCGDQAKEGDLLSSLALNLVNAGRNAEANEASRAALEALEELPPGLPLAHAYRARAALHMLDRDTAEAVTWGEKTATLAESLGATEVLAGAYNVIGAALLAAGDERGIAYFERCLRLARQSGLDNIIAVAYGNIGSSFGEQHQFARARHWLDEGIAYCAERDLDRSRLYMTAWRAICNLHLGRWDNAADAALAVVNRTSAMPISRIMALVALGRLRARRGDPEVAVVLDEALALAVQTGTLQRLAPAHAARAEAAWLAGDPARTLAEANAVFDLAVQHKHTWFMGELAYWQWRTGGREAPPEGAARPFALQIAGEWAAAAAEWARLECPYEAARALADGDDEAALRRALVMFERLGARPAVQATARRLRDLGARGIPRGPRPATRTNPFGLTAREAEIAGLIAGGLRNAEIAARLFLSAKTVEHHIAAIRAKLGVRSRAEAAREAARLGLFDQSGGSDAPN